MSSYLKFNGVYPRACRELTIIFEIVILAFVPFTNFQIIFNPRENRIVLQDAFSLTLPIPPVSFSEIVFSPFPKLKGHRLHPYLTDLNLHLKNSVPEPYLPAVESSPVNP